jgi:hypothetical protein
MSNGRAARHCVQEEQRWRAAREGSSSISAGGAAAAQLQCRERCPSGGPANVEK